MESNLDNCFYFTVFKDHRPSMAITNWLSEASSFPVPEEQAICLPPRIFVCMYRFVRRSNVDEGSEGIL